MNNALDTLVALAVGFIVAAVLEIEGKAGDYRAAASLDYAPGDGHKKASLAFPGS